MSTRLRILLLLLLWAPAGSAFGASPEYGRFEQSRQIALLPQPLISTGRYLLLPEQGLLWVVEAPLYSEMRIRDGQLQERNAVDAPWSQPLLGQGESAVLARLMMAMLAQDRVALAEYFAVTELPVEAGWALRLVPLLDAVAERVPEIHVRGSTAPQQMSWVDADGAQTQVVLSPLHEPPPPGWVARLAAPVAGGAD